ncbi:MAG: hypothetical protein ACRYGR_03620, partial [Janthinobacterium lividum]
MIMAEQSDIYKTTMSHSKVVTGTLSFFFSFPYHLRTKKLQLVEENQATIALTRTPCLPKYTQFSPIVSPKPYLPRPL